MKLKIVNKSNNALPNYETANSAGLDLRAFLPEGQITIKPLQRVLVPTGLFMEIPTGYEGQVRPRSGLAIKNGITVLNSPGTIDADYRGEVKIILVPFRHRLCYQQRRQSGTTHYRKMRTSRD